MWQLWIFSLAASFPVPAMGEVVRNFKPCSQFFLEGKPPTLKPINPARICQFYRGKYRFATMYDRNGHIPLFSAYKYQPGGMGRRKDWKIEPQLALPRERSRKSMESEKVCKIDHELLKNSQAVSEDYKQAVYDRGHLLPVLHQPDWDSKAATFTLTNIVPQFRKLNQGKWAEYESNMKKYTIGCRDTYVLVGVVPGSHFLTGGRVNIPSHIWAATCCVSQDNHKRSWAVIARNSENQVYLGTLLDLERVLGKCYGKKNINLFNSACYLGDTQPNNFTEEIQPGYKPSTSVCGMNTG